MSADDARRERLSRLGALGGLSRSAKLTPDERSESARKAGLASAAKRRADREARGEVVPPRKPRPTTGPTIDELEAYLVQIDAEGNALSYDQRIREARLRLRRDVARQTLEAFKGAGS